MQVDYKLFDEEADLTVAAPCGLYCGNCSIFRSYFDRNREKAEALGKTSRCKPDQVRCSGCRTPAKFCWSGDCEFKTCTSKKAIQFCYECDGFPCDKIREFAKSSPDHRQIWDNFDRMKAVGWRQWLREHDDRWRCKVCRAKLDFYESQCPICGTPTQ